MPSVPHRAVCISTKLNGQTFGSSFGLQLLWQKLCQTSHISSGILKRGGPTFYNHNVFHSTESRSMALDLEAPLSRVVQASVRLGLLPFSQELRGFVADRFVKL